MAERHHTPSSRKPKSLLTLCRDALRVDEQELTNLEAMARGQMSYLSPLKMATQGRQNALGRHNLNVIEKFRALREAIEQGKELAA